MRAIEFIQEARRNPEQNPKYSVFDQVEPYLDDKETFISFTAIDKIGINPSSKYQTPLGIYSYPLLQAIEMYDLTDEVIKEKGFFEQFPFAADAPYFWIFRSTDYSSLLLLTDFIYTEKRYLNDIKRLEQFYTQDAPDSVSVSFDDFVEQAQDNSRFQSGPGYIWNVTRCAAAGWNPSATKTNPVRWNKIFRDVLGYAGAVDVDAQGIIHPSEPLQAVFFSKKAIEPLKRITNSVPSMDSLFVKLLDMEDAHEYVEWATKVVGLTKMSSLKVAKLAMPYMSPELIAEILLSKVSGTEIQNFFANNVKEPENVFPYEYLVDFMYSKNNEVTSLALRTLVKKGPEYLKRYIEEEFKNSNNYVLRKLIAMVLTNGPANIQAIVNDLPEDIVNSMIGEVPELINNLNNPTETQQTIAKAISSAHSK